MGAQGTDIKLSSAAFAKFPYAVEVKCQEIHAAFLDHWVQTKNNTKKDEMPLLIITANRKPLLAVLEFDDLLGILK